MKLKTIKFLILFLIFTSVAQAQKQTILKHVLSHNDYEQKRPLLDAIKAGINAVEADVALVNGELYVTHGLDEIKKENTLKHLYLEPLRQIIENNNGFVHQEGTPFILYINTKTADETLLKINNELANYSDIVSSFNIDKQNQKPIIVICGGGDYNGMSDIYMTGEGKLNISKEIPASTIYMVNLNWKNHFTYSGDGDMPKEELDKLRGILKKVHSNGRILRFWNNPDITSEYGPNFWITVLNEGVDLLNTDSPKEISLFFTQTDNIQE